MKKIKFQIILLAILCPFISNAQMECVSTLSNETEAMIIEIQIFIGEDFSVNTSESKDVVADIDQSETMAYVEREKGNRYAVWLIENNQLELLRELLQRKPVDKNGRDFYGNNMNLFEVAKGSIEALQILNNRPEPMILEIRAFIGEDPSAHIPATSSILAEIDQVETVYYVYRERGNRYAVWLIENNQLQLLKDLLKAKSVDKNGSDFYGNNKNLFEVAKNNPKALEILKGL